MKSRVIANVSHEFRTPLHTILGLSRILLDGTDGELSEEQRKQIRFMRASAEELSTLVDDMLDLSARRCQQGDPAAGTLHRHGLHGRPARHAEAARRHAGSRLARSSKSRRKTIPLETDRGKLSQILRNLVSNALKFTERGTRDRRRDGRQRRCDVQASPTRVSAFRPTQHEQIFEEFGQVENPLQSTVKGTGLGLALSRRLAEVLGGTLTVDSEVDRGSTFTLRLPRMHPEVSEFRKLESRAIDPERAPILVVEDDRQDDLHLREISGDGRLPGRARAQHRRTPSGSSRKRAPPRSCWT